MPRRSITSISRSCSNSGAVPSQAALSMNAIAAPLRQTISAPATDRGADGSDTETTTAFASPVAFSTSPVRSV